MVMKAGSLEDMDRGAEQREEEPVSLAIGIHAERPSMRRVSLHSAHIVVLGSVVVVWDVGMLCEVVSGGGCE